MEDQQISSSDVLSAEHHMDRAAKGVEMRYEEGPDKGKHVLWDGTRRSIQRQVESSVLLSQTLADSERTE